MVAAQGALATVKRKTKRSIGCARRREVILSNRAGSAIRFASTMQFAASRCPFVVAVAVVGVRAAAAV